MRIQCSLESGEVVAKGGDALVKGVGSLATFVLAALEVGHGLEVP